MIEIIKRILISEKEFTGTIKNKMNLYCFKCSKNYICSCNLVVTRLNKLKLQLPLHFWWRYSSIKKMS